MKKISRILTFLHHDKYSPFYAGVIAFIVFCFGAALNQMGVFGDDAQYLLAARSLLEGSYIHLESPEPQPIVQFLVGYPLILMPIVYFIRDNFIILNIVSALFSALTVVLAVRLLGKSMENPMRFVLSMCVIMCPVIVSCSTMIMPGVPFCLLLWLHFNQVETYQKMKLDKIKPLLVIQMAVVAGFLFYLRPEAIVFFPAFTLYAIKERKYRFGFTVLLLVTVIIFPLYLRNLMLTNKLSFDMFEACRSGASGLVSYLKIFVVNLDYYMELIYTNVMNFRCLGDNVFLNFLKGIVMIIISFGMLEKISSGKIKYYDIFFVLNILLLLLWPWQSVRYIFPLAPLVIFYFLNGLKALETVWARFHVFKISIIIIILVSFSINLVQVSLLSFTGKNILPKESYNWINNNTLKDSIWMSVYPARFHVYTGRKTYLLPVGYATESLLPYIKAKGIHYIFIEFSDNIMSDYSNVRNQYKILFKELADIANRDDSVEVIYRNISEQTALYQYNKI